MATHLRLPMYFVRNVLGCLALAAALIPSPVRAVVYAGGTGSGQITATGAGGGWNYVGHIGGASGVYLGNYGGSYWVLTANHVGAGTFTTSSGDSYSVVGGTGVQIGGVDLYAFQITVPGGDTDLAPLANLNLSVTTPAVGTSVTMIGNGLDRAASPTTYYVDTTTNPYTWSTTFSVGATPVTGYAELGSATKRWGTNTVSSTPTTAFPGIPTTTYVVTTFSTTGTSAQVAAGDSGGGLFYLDGLGNLQLGGILDLNGTFSGQPTNTAVSGNASYSVDVATYRSAILAVVVVPEPGVTALLLIGGLALVVRRRYGAQRGTT